MTSPELLHAALKSVHPAVLSAEDAEAILEITQMAVDADGQEDPEEIRFFVAVGQAIFQLTGSAMVSSPAFVSADDDLERVRELGGKLSTKEARELAYATSHLLTVVDVQIAPEEDDFLEMLRTALGISEARADELAAQLGAAITPAD